jgi:hypothetical protein
MKAGHAKKEDLKMKCIVCQKNFSAQDLLTVVVDPRNLKKSIKPSPICGSCYDESGIGQMTKIDVVSLGPKGSIFPKDPGESLDSLISERDALREKILEVSRTGAAGFDLAAAGRRLAELDNLISLKAAFQRPAFTDRAGKISG